MNLDFISNHFPSLLLLQHDTDILNEFEKLKTNCCKIKYCLKLLDRYQNYFDKDHSNSVNNALNHCSEERFLYQNYQNALKEYNRRLCKIRQKITKDNDSVSIRVAEMSLYWKKAIIYKELKLYKQCLNNLRKIDDLLENLNQQPNYPEIKIESKISRQDFEKFKETCRKQSESEPIMKFLLPKISHKSKKNIPCIAQSIILRFNPTCGYHFTTNINLKPGSIIMAESPFSASLLPDSWYEKCAHCLSSNYLDLFPCQHCSSAMFCSQYCNDKAQAEYHCYECPMMHNISEMLSPVAMIGLRNTLKGFCVFDDIDELKEIFNDKNSSRENDFDVLHCDAKTMFQVVSRQSTNQQHRTIDDLFNLCLTAAVIYKLLVFKSDLITKLNSDQHHNLLMEMLLHFLQIGTINSFSMASLPEIVNSSSKGTRFETEHEFAIATYPFSSFLNHSCSPNVTKTNAGENHETMLVVVTRPIKAGEQIYDCYFSSVHHYKSSKEDRQKQLLEQYNFQCKCVACKNNFPLYNDLQIKCPMLNIIEIISENANLGRYSNKNLILQKYNEYCNFLKEFDESYPSKEIYVVYKCLLRCIWLLFKRPQLLYTSRKYEKSAQEKINNL